MEQLALYANIAEIFSALTIVLGGIFAIMQWFEYRKGRKVHAAAELCARFAEPELGRAVALLKHLPNGISLKEIEAMDSEYEESMHIVGMTFETMGLMIFEDMASFRLIQQLTGGLMLTYWKKAGVWIEETRTATENPKFGEWIQWLAERLEECDTNLIPAHKAHVSWNRFSS